MSNNSIESSVASQPLQGSENDGSTKTLTQIIKAPIAFLHEHLFSISVISILLYGWSRRDDNYLSAENGAGYILGIVGGSLMLLVILYPLSKRSALLKRLLPMRYWFGIHMLLGVIGPVMILYHSNFHIGSMNSTVALTSMLLVASSGLIGRYIYTKVHHGLYGKRISLEDLKNELETKHTELLRIFKLDVSLNNRLTKMENRLLQDYTSVIKSLLHVIFMAIDTRLLKYRIMRLLNSSIKNNTSLAVTNITITRGFVERYTVALRRIAVLRVYERLFSFWHILHMPLFIMMIITAVIHIRRTPVLIEIVPDYITCNSKYKLVFVSSLLYRSCS